MTANLANEVKYHPERIIKVLLVDDLKVVREKIESLLHGQPDIQVVGTASDGASALERLESIEPDAILLDLDMPGIDGIDTARIIARKYPQIKIIILSSLDRTEEINDLLTTSISAYILKTNLDLDIANCIRSVYNATEIAPNNVVKFDRSEVNEISQITLLPTSFNNTSKFTAIANTSLLPSRQKIIE